MGKNQDPGSVINIPDPQNWDIYVIIWCGLHTKDPLHCLPVLRIHDIYVWVRIWIRGSMPLTNGSGFGCW
jgi:hypothetical protein